MGTGPFLFYSLSFGFQGIGRGWSHPFPGVFFQVFLLMNWLLWRMGSDQNLGYVWAFPYAGKDSILIGSKATWANWLSYGNYGFPTYDLGLGTSFIIFFGPVGYFLTIYYQSLGLGPDYDWGPAWVKTGELVGGYYWLGSFLALGFSCKR